MYIYVGPVKRKLVIIYENSRIDLNISIWANVKMALPPHEKKSSTAEKRSELSLLNLLYTERLYQEKRFLSTFLSLR